MAGIQYLDEIFSAIRDTAEQLAIADTWLSRADEAVATAWRMSFLQAARQAHHIAHQRLEEASLHLAELGSADRLPSLLAHLPQRLEDLRGRLEASEMRLSKGLDVVLDKPRGHA